MASHVALLRGINVGGRNKVPMADLREVMTSLGHTGVSTYIQSGNVLFSTAEEDTAKLAAALESAIEDRFGIWSSVVVLSRDELARVLAANPYPDEPNPRMVHVVFLNTELPESVLTRISAAESAAAAKGSRDTVQVAGQAAGQALFLHTPDGFGTASWRRTCSRSSRRRRSPSTAWPPRPGTGPLRRNSCRCARRRSKTRHRRQPSPVATGRSLAMPEPAAWPADRRITITDLQAATDRGERWSMLTSYDTLTAGVFEQAGGARAARRRHQRRDGARPRDHRADDDGSARP